MFLTDSPERRRETFIEISKFPGWKYQQVLSGIVLLLAGGVTISLLDSPSMVKEVVIVCSATIIVFLAVGLPQFLDFQRMRGDILNKGVATRHRQSGRTQLGTLISLTLVFGPFLLLFVAPPPLWFSCVLGMIIGVSAAQFFFALHIRRWERVHGIKLQRFTKWFYNENHRRVVLEYGVRSAS